MPRDPSIPQETPRITDRSAPCAFSTDSNYRAPVKHPRLASRKHQLERDSGNTEAPLEHYFTPKVAQVVCPKALYIHPPAITPLIPSHHHTIISPFMCCIHTPCAILRALHAPIILTEFLSILHYRIFSLVSVFIRIPLTSYQPPLNQPSMRDLRVCLTYNFAPCTFTIVSNFAFSLQSRIFRVFSYRADFILATPLYNYSFWT
ncbi:hypothetical protein BD769DRAFT_1663520 [Suillus cothurnatus]|nr:hypothetical protein BD769DRAFT_1663520 [Suillus cothurnatus]